MILFWYFTVAAVAYVLCVINLMSTFSSSSPSSSRWRFEAEDRAMAVSLFCFFRRSIIACKVPQPRLSLFERNMISSSNDHGSKCLRCGLIIISVFNSPSDTWKFDLYSFVIPTFLIRATFFESTSSSNEKQPCSVSVAADSRGITLKMDGTFKRCRECYYRRRQLLRYRVISTVSSRITTHHTQGRKEYNIFTAILK